MEEAINKIKGEFLTLLKQSNSSSQIEELKVKFLGKKGPLQDLMRCLKDADKDQRPLLGKKINDLKVELSELCQNHFDQFFQIEEKKKLENEKIDVTLPGKKGYIAKAHPIKQVVNKMLSVLKEMGFSVQYGPNIESEYFNFGALNFEEDHPARDMQDTFYLSKEMLLRTHSTNTQPRLLKSHKLPLRVVSPGKVFRNEDISARSHVFFHQVDGFYVDKGVTYADLLKTLRVFYSKLFEREVKMRFRTSYFPFTEPSVEADIECLVCSSKGCKICKNTGYLEVIGAGMIHPNVLEAAGIDPNEYQGFAWGMGVERLEMLLYNIPDIRSFTENDQRFLEQF